MVQTSMNEDRTSKLLKGMIIGGLIGAAVSLMDRPTRNKVKEAALGVKDSSMKLYNEVRDHPGEIKDQFMNQLKDAASTLKDAIDDAQNLYNRLSEDVSSNVDNAKSITNEAVSTVKDSKEDLKSIGSKVAEAGKELTENPLDSTSRPAGYSTGMESSQKNNNGPMER